MEEQKQEQEQEQKQKQEQISPKQNKNMKGLIIGGGCIVIAAAIAVICLFGGEKGEEICNDESPVGFFEKKDQPKFTLSNPDATPYVISEDLLFNNPKEGVKNKEEERTFCSIYADELNKSLEEDQKMTVDQVINGTWQYHNAYASYYKMKTYASLSGKVKFPQIFDGGINCSVAGNQIYVHETNEKYDFTPTINLRKSAKKVEYFGIYAASAYGTLNIDFTLSLLKKEESGSYYQYSFTFPATIYKSNGMIPTFYGAYFEDFGIAKEDLVGCSMLSFSYHIESWDYTPAEGEQMPEEPFLKLYEILLPNSEW